MHTSVKLNLGCTVVACTNLLKGENSSHPCYNITVSKCVLHKSCISIAINFVVKKPASLFIYCEAQPTEFMLETSTL